MLQVLGVECCVSLEELSTCCNTLSQFGGGKLQHFTVWILVLLSYYLQNKCKIIF